MLHLRGPRASGRLLFDLATRLVASAREHGAKVAVNDRLDVALAVRADGVHLGQRSLPGVSVRDLAPPGMWVGVSCHNAEEVDVERGRVDYLVVGSIFSTRSHPRNHLLGVGGLEKLVRVAGKTPVVAIGGIDEGSVAPLRSVGAAGVAVLSGIWGAEDPARAVGGYIAALERTVQEAAR